MDSATFTALLITIVIFAFALLFTTRRWIEKRLTERHRRVQKPAPEADSSLPMIQATRGKTLVITQLSTKLPGRPEPSPLLVDGLLNLHPNMLRRSQRDGPFYATITEARFVAFDYPDDRAPRRGGGIYPAASFHTR